MKRISLDVWANILRNTAENNEEVEVIWLDDVPPNPYPYALVCDCELFEDDFETEKEAQDRLDEVKRLLAERTSGMIVCKRCGYAVEKSVVEGYTYSCNECDEDLYTFEVRTIE